MNHRHGAIDRCAVYHGRGDALSETCGPADLPVPRRPRVRTIADQVPLRQIMSNELICARADLRICAVLALMMNTHVGCLPVVDDRRRPVGVITKLDLVEQVDAAMRIASSGGGVPADITARTAQEVMMPLAWTLPEDATVARAAALMIAEGIHHVLVLSSLGALVGVVSTRDIVAWLVDNDSAEALALGASLGSAS